MSQSPHVGQLESSDATHVRSGGEIWASGRRWDANVTSDHNHTVFAFGDVLKYHSQAQPGSPVSSR